ILGTHRRKEHEECDKEDIEKCDEPKVPREGSPGDFREGAEPHVHGDAGDDLIERGQSDDDQAYDSRKREDDPLVRGPAVHPLRGGRRRGHCLGRPDSSGTLLGLLKVVLGNRRHRLLQDLWILPTPLREPRDDEQDGTDEEDREPDDFRGDRGALTVRSPYDEPLGKACDRRSGNAEKPPEIPQWDEAHLALLGQAHVFAPRRVSQRAYHHMKPMKAKPSTTWPTKPATAHGHGVSRRNLPEKGEFPQVTPPSGPTTGPLASVKTPYNVGPPGGIELTVGAAGMFPTFCTETPTWR